jgi:hypothetical protein
MNDAAKIAAALNLRKAGKGWRGTCPVCQDKNPSFSISESDLTGAPLIHCFAGCKPEEIIAHIKSIDATLWPNIDTSAAKTRMILPFKTYGVSDLARLRPITWLVQDRIPANGITTFIGPPSCGKSFLALDLIGAILQGRDWLGGKMRDMGAVLYIAGEGGAGFRNRIAAYNSAHAGGEWALFRAMFSRLNLLDSDETTRVIATVVDIQETYGAVKLIVLDTLNQTMAGGDENSVDGMSAYISNARLLCETFDCAILIIHHTGKDVSRGARGSSALKGAIDAEYTVIHETDSYGVPQPIRKFVCTKMRDGELMGEHAFKLVSVTLGADDEGFAQTSCVVEYAAANIADNDGDDFLN